MPIQTLEVHRGTGIVTVSGSVGSLSIFLGFVQSIERCANHTLIEMMSGTKHQVSLELYPDLLEHWIAFAKGVVYETVPPMVSISDDTSEEAGGSAEQSGSSGYGNEQGFGRRK